MRDLNAPVTLPSIEEMLKRPDVSDWLKDCLTKALRRDVVDAANDAEILAHLLDRERQRILSK